MDQEDEFEPDDPEGFEPDYEEDDLEKERREAEAQVFAGLDSLSASWSSPPKRLAHYTSLKNAVRIVDGGEMFLFNAYTLNDEQEIDHAVDFIVDRIESTKLSHLRALVEDRFAFPRRGRRSVYVFCLSPVDDLDRLSMWRAYGDDGNGVALKIRTGALTGSKSSKLSGMTPVLAEVIYDEEAKTRRVDALLAEFDRLSAARNEFSVDDLGGALMSMLWKIAPTFKHPAFAEEREWRVIVEARRSIFSSVSSSSSLIEFSDDHRPFIRMQLGRGKGDGALGELMSGTFDGALIGPSRNAHPNAATMSAALLKNHWDFDVQVSAIPYRGRP